jgi:hypothetical protein
MRANHLKAQNIQLKYQSNLIQNFCVLKVQIHLSIREKMQSDF